MYGMLFHSNTVVYILLSTHDINGKQTAPSLKLRCSNSYVLFDICDTSLVNEKKFRHDERYQEQNCHFCVSVCQLDQVVQTKV